jgi:uncharacterized ferredoxin-like protein
MFVGLALKICDFTMISPVSKIKKDNQEWKPPNCLIYKPFDLVAGPGIEPGTS